MSGDDLAAALARAIERRRLVEFDYRDLHRVAEPYTLGVNGGVEQLLAYQVGGASRPPEGDA